MFSTIGNGTGRNSTFRPHPFVTHGNNAASNGLTNSMSRRTGWLLFLLLAAVFLLVNRESYQGYFRDDEITSMAWTRWKSSFVYLQGALTPIYKDSFRAVGFLLVEPMKFIFSDTDHRA